MNMILLNLPKDPTWNWAPPAIVEKHAISDQPPSCNALSKGQKQTRPIMDMALLNLPKDPTWNWAPPSIDEKHTIHDHSPSKNALPKSQKQTSPINCRRRGKRNVGSSKNGFASVSRKARSSNSMKKEAIPIKAKRKQKFEKKRVSVKSSPLKGGQMSNRSRNHRWRGKHNVGDGKAAVSDKAPAASKEGRNKTRERQKKNSSESSQRKAPVVSSAKCEQNESVKGAVDKRKAGFASPYVYGVFDMDIE
eukprot:14139867-Ditylum_brightwellii.AAC.1